MTPEEIIVRQLQAKVHEMAGLERIYSDYARIAQQNVTLQRSGQPKISESTLCTDSYTDNFFLYAPALTDLNAQSSQINCARRRNRELERKNAESADAVEKLRRLSEGAEQLPEVQQKLTEAAHKNHTLQGTFVLHMP